MFSDEENVQIDAAVKQAAALAVVGVKALGEVFEALTDDDTADKAAKAAKKAVAAYEAQGFSREEAINLYMNLARQFGSSSS